MRRHIRLLFGISVFWLALSVLTDGINTLVLPLQISVLTDQHYQATILGFLTFLGLLAGALVQPIAGAFSDKLYPRLGRKGFIAIGLLASLISLFLFAILPRLFGVIVGYLAIQISASIAQAGQQGLIPDLVYEHRRGLAAGFKGFMDLTGAMVGFVLLGQLLGSGKTRFALAIIAAILVAAYILAVFLTPEDKARKESAIKTRTVSLQDIFQLDLREHAAFVQLVIARFLFLLGIYITGRFLLLFVSNRLGISGDQAAQQAGNILAMLALVTILASPFTGWLADRLGRIPLMIAGSILSAVSAMMLVWAHTTPQILIFGGLMSLGSAAFAGGSWALLADLVPKDSSARFFGLANFSTAGSAAAAGLLGPLVDWGNRISNGMGFSLLFAIASLAFLAGILPLRSRTLKVLGENYGNKRKVRANDSGLAVISLSTDLAHPEEDSHP
jgi:MFS family permease